MQMNEMDYEDLDMVLDQTDQFPAPSEDLAGKARELNASESVVNFFEALPRGTTFEDKLEVINRVQEAEQVQGSTEQPSMNPLEGDIGDLE